MAMQNEVAAYAACQKDERGLDKVVEDAKYRMKRYGGGCLLPLCLVFELVPFTHSLTAERSSPLFAVTPNLLVIPPQENSGRLKLDCHNLPLTRTPHRPTDRIPFPPQMSLYMALAPDEKITYAYPPPYPLRRQFLLTFV